MSAVKRIERESLCTDAVTIVRKAILDGAFQPGERLVEGKLATEMGISRNPLREAFRTLERDGLVVNVPRKGTFVAILSADDVGELYAIRAALEGLAISEAIDRMKPDDVDALEAALEGMRAAAAAGDFVRALECDVAFHREICRLSGNRRLLQLWNGLASQIQLVHSRVRDTHFALAGIPAHIEGSHQPLLDAIRKRDAREAQTHLARILEAGRRAALELEQSQ